MEDTLEEEELDELLPPIIDSDDDYRSKDLDFFKDSLIGRPDLRRK